MRDEVWSCCATLYVLHFVGVLFTHPVGCLEFVFQATGTGPNSDKNFANRQTLKNAENSNCSSSHESDPSLTTITKLLAGFPATLCRTSSLCEGRLHNVQTLVLFAFLFVDCGGWFCSLAESLPGARRANVCILFSLEQSQVVD